MAILKAQLNKLPDGDLIAKSRNVVNRLAANAATFTDPNPPLPEVADAIVALEKAKQEAESGAHFAFAEVRAAREALKRKMRVLASYVSCIAGGDETTMLLAGFPPRKKRERLPPPAAPTKVQVRSSAFSGAVDLKWKCPTSRCYAVEMATSDPSLPSVQWEVEVTSMKRSCTIHGLVPGRAYWFRVSAMNGTGQGPASQPFMAHAGW